MGGVLWSACLAAPGPMLGGGAPLPLGGGGERGRQGRLGAGEVVAGAYTRSLFSST